MSWDPRIISHPKGTAFFVKVPKTICVFSVETLTKIYDLSRQLNACIPMQYNYTPLTEIEINNIVDRQIKIIKLLEKIKQCEIDFLTKTKNLKNCSLLKNAIKDQIKILGKEGLEYISKNKKRILMN